MNLRPTMHFIRPAAALMVAAGGAGLLAWSPASAHGPAGGVADLVERVAPSVVTIMAAHAAPERAAAGQGSPFEEFFRRFGGAPEGFGGAPAPRGPFGGPFGAPERQGGGVAVGSGFVLDADGYVVTNNHVVDDAEKVTVRLPDAREFEATVLGVDPQSDLALLKIDAEGLPHVSLGDSDAVRVGEDVVAVGNPFGLGGTVTRGIVSAVSRDIDSGPYVDFIQTDAAINRGNSGGPLFDMDGEVIGVNSAIFSPNGGSVGVGFAIPSNDVAMVVGQIRDHGSVERGWLGVSIQQVTPDLAAALGLDGARGALVADVQDGSPADGALRVGDVILSYDASPVDESRDLPRLVGATPAGENATLTVLRDGAEKTVAVAVGRLDAARLAAAETPGGGAQSSALDATVAALTPQTRRELGLAEDVEGVVVTSLKSGGHAMEAGLRVGDVVTRIGGRPVTRPGDVEAGVKDAANGALLVQIIRDGAPLFVGVPTA